MFVHEALQLLASGGEGRLALLAGSESVAAVIRRRVANLAAEGRAVLPAASVLGREIAPELLMDLLGLPELELERRLEALAAAGVLERRAGSWVFSHVLVREALYDDLSATERRELHARVVDALEDLTLRRPLGQPAALRDDRVIELRKRRAEADEGDADAHPEQSATVRREVARLGVDDDERDAHARHRHGRHGDQVEVDPRQRRPDRRPGRGRAGAVLERSGADRAGDRSRQVDEVFRAVAARADRAGEAARGYAPAARRSGTAW